MPDAGPPSTAPVTHDHLEVTGAPPRRPAPGPAAPWRRLLRRLPVPHLPPDDRALAVEALMVEPDTAALRRFAVLLLLSTVVASVGLLQDSGAVVIGAMMIAPLMAPIMGIAASMVMGWPRRLLVGLAVVAASVTAVVVVAWAITRLIPAAGTGLPGEVLARSSPDVRDLLVALAAGAAGSYATVRRQVSGALPGVAVAVALVPPLACVGVLLGRGQPGLARGAALLFTANLVGIVLAAAVVLLATGFVPAERMVTGRRRVLTALAAVAVPALAVAAVLSVRFAAVAGDARDLEVATRTVVTWLGGSDDLEEVVLRGSTVEVNVASVEAPPAVADLTEALTAALGRATTADLRWTPVTDPDAAATTDVPVLDLAELRPVVETWLAGQDLTLDGLGYDGSGLVVSTSGEEPPGDGDDLSALIAQELGAAVPVSLSWTSTAEADPSPTGTAEDAAVTTARSAAVAWAGEHPGTAVLDVEHAGDAVTVTVIAVEEPDPTDLRAALQAALPRMSVTVQWVPGSVLGSWEPDAAAAATSTAATATVSPTGTAGGAAATGPATPTG